MQLAIIIILLWIICGLSIVYVDAIKNELKESKSSLISQLLMLVAIGPIILTAVLMEKKNVQKRE
jgi:cell division protein FtsW (lipid II flippase)